MAKSDRRLAPSKSPSANPSASNGTIPVSRYMLFFGIAIVGGAVDLLTKEWVFLWRGMPGEQPIWWLWDGFVGIETSLNPGALFGMGAGYSWLFASLSIAAATGILVWLFIYGAARDRLLTIALGSVTGGIIGNLYDRLGLWHLGGVPAGFENYTNCVRDWILFRYQQYTWPNFNIADSLLVCGAALLVWHALWFREEKPATKGQTGK